MESRQGPLVVAHGAVPVPHEVIGSAALGIDGRGCSAKEKGNVETDQSRLIPVDAAQGNALIEASLGIEGVDIDGPVVVRDGSVPAALCGIAVGSMVVGAIALSVECERPVVVE